MTIPEGPGQSARLLSEIAKLLDDLEIPYAVIGGLAASFHGVVRSSLDADAVLSESDSDQIQVLISRLERSHLRVTYRQGDFGDPINGVVDVEDKFLNKVDLLTGIRGLSADFARRTIEVSLFGESLRMIGLEDFIAMKIFAGAPRDLQDVRAALKVSRESLDKPLVLHLAEQYGLRTTETLKEFLSEEGLGDS